MEEEVKRMKEYLLKQMKQKGHLSYEKQIKYLKRFKDGVLGDNPRSMAKKDAAEELLKNSEQDLAKKIEQLKESNQNATIMNHEFLRMQELAGVPVNEEKESLNENQIGGIVGIGAIHTPKREKSDYEMAFEHFMNEEMDPITGTDIDDIDTSEPKFDDEITGTDIGTIDMEPKYLDFDDVEGEPKFMEEQEEGIPDVERIDKFLPKINNKAEYMELLPKVLDLNPMGVTSALKLKLLRDYIKKLS